MAILGAVLNEGGFRRHLIFIEDIGTGGLKFRSDVPYKASDHIELLIKLADETFNVRAQVRHVSHDWFGHLCGVHFIQPDGEFVRRIAYLFTENIPQEVRA